ncbi:hypothetical protein SVAN01_06456 [Stagonosporopsis vannaccii]|nr:hypothetical protein SVAN01_06456 [Stagonosporopsis vannaccii]
MRRRSNTPTTNQMMREIVCDMSARNR